MYAGGASHPLRDACRRVLRHVVEGRLAATTSAEVVQEILHRFTAGGRHDVGARMARYTLDLFAPVVPVSHEVMGLMPDLVRRYRTALARDLVHVATCIGEGIPAVITPDIDFDSFEEVDRLAPDDPGALEPYLV